jgi:F-type H+-transporting ATPase subunit b
MDINITLLIEMLTFGMLVWLTMRFIWPPILKAIEDRQKKIANGLAAGARGERGLELAQKKVKEQLLKTKIESANIIGQTNKQAALLVEAAKKNAEEATKKVLILAKEEIAAEAEIIKKQLRAQVANLVIEVSHKILGSKIDATINEKLVNEFIEEI